MDDNISPQQPTTSEPVQVQSPSDAQPQPVIDPTQQAASTPAKQSEAPTPAHIMGKPPRLSMHRVFLIILIALVVVFGIAYIGVYYLLNQQLNKLSHSGQPAPVAPTQPAKIPTPTSIPTPTTIASSLTPTPSTAQILTTNYNPTETSGFPVYPGSTFVGKAQTPPCETSNGYGLCGGFSYTWESNDDGDKVTAFYRSDPTGSGWKCIGGAGDYTSPRDQHVVTRCQKGSMVNDLNITATAEKTTLIFETYTAPTPTP